MKNAKTEIVWVSETTGEIQETLAGAIKTALEGLFKYHFIDLVWRRQFWDGYWQYYKK